MDKIIELREKRAKLVEDQRAILDTASGEKREMTSEEEKIYEDMDKDFDKLTDEITAIEESEQKRNDRLARLEKREENLKKVITPSIKLDPDPEEQREKDDNESTPSDIAFRSFLAGGLRGLNTAERRALQADEDVQGGFLIAPQMFVSKLIQALDNMTYVRQMATVISVTNAQSVGCPVLDNDPTDPTWTAEIKTGSEDSTMDFEKRELFPHPLAQRIKVSNKLIRISAVGVDSIVRERLAYKFGVVTENAYLNGTGSNQPVGVFVASDSGITTGRDVSTGNITTDVRADGLIEAKYTLKPQYHKGARWIFHRDCVKKIRKLKTGEGDYIWRQGIASDRPDTILDIPYYMSEYAPNTFTTGLYVGILGDFSYYWIVDALNMQVQVLNELYAETNQTGYIGRLETDGMPVLEEAFVRVKLA